VPRGATTRLLSRQVVYNQRESRCSECCANARVVAPRRLLRAVVAWCRAQMLRQAAVSRKGSRHVAPQEARLQKTRAGMRRSA